MSAAAVAIVTHHATACLESRRPTATQRGYGPQWRRLRRIVLLRNPICGICGTAPSTEADHIIPRRQGGPDTLENLEAKCKPCQSRKTVGEMARGEGGRWG